MKVTERKEMIVVAKTISHCQGKGSLTEKSAALSETTSALVDNQTLLKHSAEKVSQIKDVDGIETGKTLIGGKVTVARKDYDKLADLAKKQIAVEHNDGKLHQQIDELTQENENLKDETTSLKKEIQTLRPFRFELSKVQNELRELKGKHLRVLEFIKSLGLVEKLQAFLNPRARGQRR